MAAFLCFDVDQVVPPSPAARIAPSMHPLLPDCPFVNACLPLVVDVALAIGSFLTFLCAQTRTKKKEICFAAHGCPLVLPFFCTDHFLFCFLRGGGGA